MVCLPKKSTTQTPNGTPAFTTNNTRPLNIVNADSRLVASAARNRWEKMLGPWVLDRQQGFLPGRSILRNLLEMDIASMHTALMQDRGACLLLDFASAFPSISQDFVFSTLKSIGVPENALNFMTALYDESYCRIRHGQAQGSDFLLLAGVRQGCPLSPLLYATVAEVLLDRIEEQCPNTLARAYADDTALVCEDFEAEGPILEKLLREFEEVSGLRLNLQKCIIIPLGTKDVGAFRRQRDNWVPGWRTMLVEGCGKYLGFWVGPTKGEKSWTEPLQKFQTRCTTWAEQGMGLYLQTQAYNTFAQSTLMYIAQLEIPSPQVLLEEGKGLTKAIRGPGGWAVHDDLWRLKEHFGQQVSCKSLQHAASASKFRVLVSDPACRGEDFKEDTRLLQKALADPNNLSLHYFWRDWFSRSFAVNLLENQKAVVEKLGPVAELLRDAKVAETAIADDDEHSDKDNGQQHNDPTQLRDNTRHDNHNGNQGTHNRKKRNNIQKYIYNKLLLHNAPNPIERTRNKLARWRLHVTTRVPPPPDTPARHTTPNWQAHRAIHLLEQLTTLTAPRIRAAVFSTLWNRWCTHRRWQRRHSTTNKCVLGCSPTAEDSIEHYCKCHFTRTALSKQLNLPPQHYAHLHTFTLCNTHITTEEELTSVALLVYAIYTATNHFRHNPPSPTCNVHDSIAQWIREGAKNHNKSTYILDNRWNPHMVPTHITPPGNTTTPHHHHQSQP